MSTFLEKIIETKRGRVEAVKALTDPRELERQAFSGAFERRGFRDAVANRNRTNVIAEFKRASPSKGVINDTLGPADAAVAYRDGGASAISVLTEEDFFSGSLDDLCKIRTAVDLPILRKDFVIDEVQILESAAAGADAILLIVAALNIGELARFQSQAHELGLDTLIEVHDRDEMKTAADIGADLIGVNNRDLQTFEVSLDVSRELIAYAPRNAVMIAESGISSRQQIEELSGLGYSGFLVGESLMRSDDTVSSLEDWL